MSMLREFLKLKQHEEHEREKALNLPTKRLYATERDAFLEMTMVKRIIGDLETEFEKRYEMTGSTETMKRIKDDIKNVYDRIYYTVPQDQRRTLDINVDNCIVAVGVKAPGSVGEHTQDKDYGIYIPYDDMHTMVEALHDHCLVCMGSAQEQAACKLRKVFDRLGVAVEHVNGECGYREMI